VQQLGSVVVEWKSDLLDSFPAEAHGWFFSGVMHTAVGEVLLVGY
jgi:hypothetical protein